MGEQVHLADAVSDPARLAALEAYGIQETTAEPGFDDIVQLAAELCDTPTSLVSFLLADRQWFEAKAGFTLCETPLTHSVCVHGLLEPGLLIIPDLSLDPRTRDNPVVTGHPFIRFYAGAPLTTPDRIVLGMLCVIDTRPRPEGLTAAQSRGLRGLGRQVMLLLEARRAIRERDRAMADYSRSEAVLSEAASLARLGIFEWNVETDAMTVSARGREMFGFAPDAELTGQRYGARIVAPDVERLRAEFAAGKASREPLHFNYRIERPDGVLRQIVSVSRPRFAPDGTLTHYVGAIRDVTDEHGAALALVESEAALRALNEQLEQRVAERTKERDQFWSMSNLLLLIAALDSTILAVGPGWEAMLGWPEAELLGRSYAAFIHPDDVERSLAWARRIAAGDTVEELENRYRGKDGRYRSIAWTITDGEGLLRCVGRDVTIERQQALELARTEEQLRQAQKMEAVGQLTGGIAHDFNNLLTGITASLELLQVRLGQGRLQDLDRYVNAAQESARRAAALTHRLLAFSRRQTLAPKPTDVRALVGSMEELIRRSVGPSIAVELAAADELWPSLIDPSQLESAVLNLCINARDAMPGGGRITIGINNRRLGTSAAEALGVSPGRYVALSVADNGMGMASDVVERVFEPFFTTKPTGMGTGLGLSMIYGFAKQSGGTVGITSVVGEGTTVCIYLPRHVGRVEHEKREIQLLAAPPAEAGETVLMVDDEPTIRMLMGEVLSSQGYAVLEAEDGPSGLAEIRSQSRIDLLLTDVGLPGGLNGRQLADAARAMRPGLKVLFITGYAESSVLDGCDLDFGMHVLAKPFTLESLVTRIQTILAA